MDAVIESGRCCVCGHEGDYVKSDAPTRENYACSACDASLRYRLQAAAITSLYGRPELTLAELAGVDDFRRLAIYEPGIIGPFRRVLSGLPGYVNSYYWKDVPPGPETRGVRCEDLRNLTFDDASMDLVISSDIFEHIRGPMQAFAEVFRVLRPGGSHNLTVPLAWPLPGETRQRVDCSGAEDVFLLPPEYHDSPTDPSGSLVYTDFGMDLPENLRALGFETTIHHGYRNAVTFACRKPGPISG